MAIVQALLAALFHSAGKLLNMAFGWATILLFGKVPQDRQLYLSVIAFGSVIWLVAVVAIVFPDFGTFLLAFVTLPPWVSRAWIRIAMAIAAILIPAIVGWISTRLVDPAQRPRGGRATLVAVGRGYPYTVGLAVTLIMLTVFAPVLKVRNMGRRWTAQHVPVIIKAEDYLEVLDDLQTALERGGLRTRRKRASWMLRVPTKILTVFSRCSFNDFIADRLTRLVNKKIEVLMHPSDLVISGRETDAARARAILSEHLTVTKAYLTWDTEANDVEDRLREFWAALEANRLGGLADRLEEIERHLRTLTLPYEEWEVLFRQTLMAERALLQKPASAFLKSPALGRRLVATLVAAAPLMMQAADTVREVRELAAPLQPRRNHTLADHVVDQLGRLLARTSGGDRLKRFLGRAA